MGLVDETLREMGAAIDRHWDALKRSTAALRAGGFVLRDTDSAWRRAAWDEIERDFQESGKQTVDSCSDAGTLET